MRETSRIRPYLAFFRLRFVNGLQYRAAALGGIATQFAWGGMNLLLYSAYYRSNPAAFPMTQAATSNYVWMYQALLAAFATWMLESDIIDAVTTGGIAYELARPTDLYTMWFVKSLGNRFARAFLRCVPILVIAAFLPAPYGLTLPPSFAAFGLFLVSFLLSVMIVTAYTMLIYGGMFFTVSPAGFRLIAAALVDFCAGGLIPLPFMPEGMRVVLELSPFGSMQNVCLRICTGDIPVADAFGRIALQVFWLVTMLAAGRLIFARAARRVVVQGG